MTHHKLYIAFDVNGEPFAVSPDKDSFRYHDPERVREFASKEVADCIADGQVNLMVKVNELQEALKGLRIRFVALFDSYVRKTYHESSHPDNDLKLALFDTDAALESLKQKDADNVPRG